MVISVAPKSVVLKKPVTSKIGGQADHPGHTLQHVEIPDHQVQHFPQSCQGCHQDLTRVKAVLAKRRQVFELGGYAKTPF